MHLKSLTLRGFKSFASSTTLTFEPGVNAVVGPNGSGKSNVVDAIAWVLGEQGAKSLRGGKMEDVIFAGTRSRPPLGRAEIVLTIDNSDGALPIDYAEVTVSRLMYRSGESEYAVNGRRCRLLDVVELLSDSGIGREMHVIVGQGQLDAVLSAAAHDRRAYIEEAAGVLKHRRRKDKALRKLAATDENLARLGDLLAEIRRQLKPLGRQAKAARRAATLSAEARDARARVTAEDVLRARDALAKLDSSTAQDQEALDALREDLSRAEAEAERSSGRHRAQATALARLRDTQHSMARLTERGRGLLELARERAAAPTRAAAPSGPDPAELDAEAEQLGERAALLAQESTDREQQLAACVTDRADAEAAADAAQREYDEDVRAHAKGRERLARVEEKLVAAETRLRAAGEAIRGQTETWEQAKARLATCQEELDSVQESAESLEDDSDRLETDHTEAEQARQAAGRAVDELARTRAGAQAELERSRARAEALALGLTSKDGAAALLSDASDAPPRPDGVLGLVGALVSVAPGHEAALAAALGPAAEAVAVDGMEAAVGALAWLRSNEEGRSGVLATRGVPGAGGAPVPTVPAGASRLLPGHVQRLSDLVGGPEPLAGTVRRLVADVVLVADLDAAREMVSQEPDLRAVTPQGDLVGSLWSTGGTGSPSLVEVRAAHDEALAAVEAAQALIDRTDEDLAAAEEAVSAARAAEQTALTRLHESDARITAKEQEIGQRRQAWQAAAKEAARCERAAERARSDAAAAERDLEAARASREEASSHAGERSEPSPETKERTAEVARAARAAETQARLELRTAQEQHSVVVDQAAAARRRAKRERQARAEAEAARVRQERAARAADEIAVATELVLDSMQASAAEVETTRGRLEGEAADSDRAAAAARRQLGELRRALEERGAAVHRQDVALAETRVRVADVESAARERLHMEPDELIAEFGPTVPVAVSEDEDADPVPYVRAEQEARLAKAEQELARIGQVNPLALEEFAALEERHDFLAGQMEDVKQARRELTTVVREIEERIRTVFAEAFVDVAAEFQEVFRTLFPGGEGSLVLTDPDDPLTTGVEVEARPPGKKVKRLSLLSGGERSLTALALLVAIFRARPSPFYVLDEVEAALDDTNLRRLVGLLSDLSESSQLIVITHQKHTMEAADALYGVSMRSDGISQVISQRLAVPAQAEAVEPA